MTPLVPLPPDAQRSSWMRNALLARSPEFFQHVFGGRTPTFEEQLAWVESQLARMVALPTFANDLYVVIVEPSPPFYRLSVQRHDRQPCRSWKDLQTLKNQLFGARHEAIELFPSEDRLIDTSNEYHLWVHSDPSYRFPVGFQSARCVEPPAAVAS